MVRARLDYITQLEAEVQDLKLLRNETAQRVLVAESEKENIAVQSLRNQQIASHTRKTAVVTEQHAIVEKSYLAAQYARAKANEEEVLRELKELKTEHHLLKLDFASARLQHTAHVKHLERDVHILQDEKVATVRTLTENYENIIRDQISKQRDFREEVIDFLKHIVELADGLKVKQVKIDSVADIERREEELVAFNKLSLKDYVGEAKEFLLLDPLLKDVALGKPIFQTVEQLEALQLLEEQRIEAEAAAKKDEEEKVQKDREERVRIRALAEETPKLQKLVQRLEAQIKDMRAENDNLKVELAKQTIAFRKQPLDERKDVEYVSVDNDHVGATKSELQSDDRPAGPPGLNESNDEPELEAADVELKLDRNFDEIPEGSKERMKFEELFLDDVSKALGVPRHLLQIKQIKKGSIVVEFTILPQATETDESERITPLQLARKLEEQMMDETSALKNGIVTCSTVHIKSRPSSASSSAANSARKHYDPSKALASPQNAIAQREEQRRAKLAARRKAREDNPDEEDLKAAKEKAAEETKKQEHKKALEKALEAEKRKQQEREDNEKAEALSRIEEAKKQTEQSMREAEVKSGAEPDPAEMLPPEPESYWWDSHQNHKLDNRMEVCSPEIGDPNRHVRVYFHSTFKEFLEERAYLARHVYPELMHLCAERGVSFSPIDLYWQTVDQAEAERPEQLHYALDQVDRSQYYLLWFGGKYGWKPPANQVNIECKNREWLSNFRGSSTFEVSLGEIIFERAVLSNIENVQGRAFFYFRDETYADGYDEVVKLQFIEEDFDELEKLHALKEKMRQTHMQVLEDYTQPMNSVRQAFEDLQECIHRDFPMPSTSQEIDTMRERHSHSSFAKTRHMFYLPAEEWIHRLHSHLDTRAHVSHPLIIVAPSGGGKTALVSNYCLNFRHLIPQGLWIQYYIGCTNESTNYQRLCCSIMQAIKERWNFDEELPKRCKPHEWQKELLIWLGMAATRGKTVLFIDGLDQIDDAHDNALDLMWLPRSFPAEVRTVISCSPGPALDTLLERGWPCLELDELDIETRAEIAERFIASCNYKPIDVILKNEVLELPMSSNPTFLLQLIDELSILEKTGRNKEESDYVLYLQALDMTSFYDYVLWKWEKFFDGIHPNFVRRVTCLVWAARWGISEQEILNILCDIPRIGLIHFFDTTKYCWHWHDGMVNFAHHSLRLAIEYRYLPTKLEKIGVHRQLGGYFRTHPLGRRRLDEEAWHWLQGESWLELLSTLNNFAYFPRLYDMKDGTYHCDLRRYYLAVNMHLDAANGLLQGIKRFEETGPEPALFFSIAQILADFFADMGRPTESTAMYRKMLGQPDDLLNSSFSMRLRIANLRVSMAKVLQAQWDGGERNFSLLNEGRDCLETARAAYEELVIIAEDARDAAQQDQDLPEAEKKIAHRVYEELVMEHSSVLGISGRLCIAQGDYEAGEQYLMQGLYAFERFSHSNHPAVAVICQGLAELYYQRRIYDKAEAMARRAVQVRHICFGWNHPQFAHALVTLASILSAVGNSYEADTMMRRQAKILAMYPDMTAFTVRPPKRTVQEDLQGADGWQGPEATHGALKSALKSSAVQRVSFLPDNSGDASM